MVLVTEVPMLAPMMIGMAGRTGRIPEATMETVMEVVVEELWRRTVPNKPIIKPVIGLLSTAFDVNTSLAALPPSNLKASARNPREQMKRYKRPKRITNNIVVFATRFNLPKQSNSLQGAPEGLKSST